jgi:hypothetical protein
MSGILSRGSAGFVAHAGQPLIAILVEHGDEEEIHYFVDDVAADAALGQTPAIRLAGIWSDLDADEMLASLDRIRHENKPTPPIDLDL